MKKLINFQKNEYSRIDTTLLDKIRILADKERKIKEYKRRLRLKGKVMAKGMTKNGNISLTIGKDEDAYKFTVLKSHKERYALAEKIKIGKGVSIEGIPKFRMIICSRLKIIDKGINGGKQIKLNNFSQISEEKDY